MGTLSYFYLTSLDGFVEDRDGAFGWARPDGEVHQFVNDLERSVGTYLYGRRMYDVMTVWETDPDLAASSPVAADFAQIWQGAEKIVYSTTLTEPTTRHTRIERTFDADAVRQLKQTAAHEIGVGGADLASYALAAGLLDELRVCLAPVVVGDGKRLLPTDLHLDLRLLEERRFAGGMVYLRYAIRG